MGDLFSLKINKITVFLVFVILLSPVKTSAQQRIGLGIHVDPVISWFSTDIDAVTNEGARAGINFGLTYNKYFGPNYSFSTGINIVNAGGKLVCTDTTLLELPKLEYKIATVLPNEVVVYKIQYLSVPIGLKLQTNQIGYFTIFTDLGIDPKVVIGGKVDIPSLDIKGEKATSELRMFNLSYHITGGIEYSIGGNTEMVLGITFDNNFLDITKDNGDQPSDKVSHKLFSFRLGVNF
jgi:hypothetical protein